MQEFLIALAIAGAATQPNASPSTGPISKQETRYIQELRTTLRAFQSDTTRFSGMVNGAYSRKNPAELKKMEETFQSLQKGDRAIHVMSVPSRVKLEHDCLIKGCDLIVAGASVFFGAYRTGVQPKDAQKPLSEASVLFTSGYRELTAANDKIVAWLKKPEMKK
ncbi:MAG TPA: hypothetical protein DD435_01155 [Cyanobacteria bacterium UBA8530]|nr:hypothetical protein [Cyanobacteria bacterium UBA8530]